MTAVLAVAAEVFPLIKTGGLADVVGALPGALAGSGIEMRVMVPGYPAVMKALGRRKTVHHYDHLFGGPADIVSASAAGLELLVVDAPHLFTRAGNPYVGPDGLDWPDNWSRFAALSRAAADVGLGAVTAFRPDVVHAHDWQTGLVPALLHFAEGAKARSIITIHNLAFQGNFPAAIFPELGLPEAAFALDGIEYYGGVGYLKGGLRFADVITTVSPTYAEEICTPEGGMGFDGLLRARHVVLSGIVNGIDTGVWNPASDADLPATFTATSLGRRARNKREIESRFGLATGDGPLFTVISRLTWQKGIDLLAGCLDELIATGGRLAVLGAGDAAFEGLLRAAAAQHPGRIGVTVGYDETLAHLLQGGADAILIPSRFEPCGLTQFCALRYGCVPIVARVGGLADTIIDANDAALSAGVATGLQFFPPAADGLRRAIARAVRLYADGPAWTALQRRGMKSDVSWTKSAARYAELYKSLAKDGD